MHINNDNVQKKEENIAVVFVHVFVCKWKISI